VSLVQPRSEQGRLPTTRVSPGADGDGSSRESPRFQNGMAS
jgi:hypothetical protein